MKHKLKSSMSLFHFSPSLKSSTLTFLQMSVQICFWSLRRNSFCCHTKTLLSFLVSYNTIFYQNIKGFIFRTRSVSSVLRQKWCHMTMARKLQYVCTVISFIYFVHNLEYEFSKYNIGNSSLHYAALHFLSIQHLPFEAINKRMTRLNVANVPNKTRPQRSPVY